MLQIIGKNRKELGVALLLVAGAVSVAALIMGQAGVAGTVMGGAFIAFGTLVSTSDSGDPKDEKGDGK